ncbi:MAG: hypothetical protein INQ03_12745 [Candidatus Heimdallarchaeota archaeon]|nr:hypothetical protein [Candidatus Heimdallarchaeota archaeon]
MLHLRPRIDYSKCVGHGNCINVCKHNVLQRYLPSKQELENLPSNVRKYLELNGGYRTYVKHKYDCRNCWSCVSECPEKAITLIEDDFN